MADVSVEAELILTRDMWLQTIRAAQADLSSLKAMAAGMDISVPVRVVDQATPQLQQIVTRLDGQTIDLSVIVEDRASAQIEAIREANEANPVVLPVVAGGSGFAAAGGGSSESSTGFFAGMTSRRAVGATFLAFHGINTLSQELDLVNDSDIDRMSDPMEQLRKKRSDIEKEHSGPRGAMNWVYGKLGLQPTYDEEMEQLRGAEQQMQRTMAADVRTKRITANQTKLREGIEDTDIEIIPSEFKRKSAEIDLALKRHLEAADKILGGWPQYGFHTYAEAEKAVAHLKDDARSIADDAKTQLELKRDEYRVRTQEISLRAHGKPSEAEVLDIEETARRNLILSRDDPSRQRDVLQRAQSELEEFIHEQTKPHIFSNELSYSRFLQESAYNDGGNALGRARRDLTQNLNAQGQLNDDAFGGGGPMGKAADDISEAADKLSDAATTISNAKSIAIVRD